MKKFFSEFKAFITKGNILDMAVGVIIGGAFNTIVTTLNKQILMPIVNYFLSFIPGMENGLYTIMPNSKLIDTIGMTEEEIAAAQAAAQLGPDGLYYNVLNYINWSAFIESIINFLFVAMTLFIIVKVAKAMAENRKKMEAKLAAAKAQEEPAPEPEPQPEPEPEPQPDPVVVLLQEIRDSLKKSE